MKTAPEIVQGLIAIVKPVAKEFSLRAHNDTLLDDGDRGYRSFRPCSLFDLHALHIFCKVTGVQPAMDNKDIHGVFKFTREINECSRINKEMQERTQAILAFISEFKS